jgi:DNA (cytosine-5)-methyltransferase 1
MIGNSKDSSRASHYFKIASKSLKSWKAGLTASNRNRTEPDAQVIDLFSGCGGMSLGFAALSEGLGAYRLVGAADLNLVSLDTYARNFGSPALQTDVRELAYGKGLLKGFLRDLPEYDPAMPLVLIGCAPCQGFTAHRKKRWDTTDDRNDLIGAFAEVAAKLAPDCIIMENVPELFSYRYWEHFEAFRSRLEIEGYTVKQAIHNAAEYGVPQERFRAVVVAMRNSDFALPNAFVNPNRFATVRDAIGDLPPVEPGVYCSTDSLHRSAAHRKSTVEVIRAVPKDGGSRPPGVGPECLQDIRGFADVYGRLFWDRPAITITHYARNPASGRFVHPEQDRGLTMREAARLQGFPDGYEFTGGFDDIFRQIGEAVPPPLAAAIAASTLANLRGESDPDQVDKLIEEPVNDSYSGVIAGIKASRR